MSAFCACIFFSQYLSAFLPAYCRRMNDDIGRGEVVERRFGWLLMCGSLLSSIYCSCPSDWVLFYLITLFCISLVVSTFQEVLYESPGR